MNYWFCLKHNRVESDDEIDSKGDDRVGPYPTRSGRPTGGRSSRRATSAGTRRTASGSRATGSRTDHALKGRRLTRRLNSARGGTIRTMAAYDAVLLVSFGGPEQPEDVYPFLRNVTAGRGIPDERLAEVAEHYFHFGGRSPINDQNRALLAALREELAPRPVYWGNRNWDPS